VGVEQAVSRRLGWGAGEQGATGVVSRRAGGDWGGEQASRLLYVVTRDLRWPLIGGLGGLPEGSKT
jgi:hypothetical protein